MTYLDVYLLKYRSLPDDGGPEYNSYKVIALEEVQNGMVWFYPIYDINFSSPGYAYPVEPHLWDVRKSKLTAIPLVHVEKLEKQPGKASWAPFHSGQVEELQALGKAVEADYI